jgi:hypothetical protein
MVHYLVLSRHSVVRLPLLLGSRSALVCAPSFVSCPHSCCSLMMMMMETVASFETLVSVYQATRRQIPEDLLFTSAAVRTLNVAFLRRGHKKNREGQVGVRYLRGIILFVRGFGSW